MTNATSATKAPLFYWNGMKDAKGAKLQRAQYSAGPYVTLPNGTFDILFDGMLTIYASDYSGFSSAASAAFKVENASDPTTDYFEKDKIRVLPAHPLYPQVKAAMEQQEAHRAKRYAKRAGGAL